MSGQVSIKSVWTGLLTVVVYQVGEKQSVTGCAGLSVLHFAFGTLVITFLTDIAYVYVISVAL